MNSYRFDRIRALVVGDNPHRRKLVATILHGFGVMQILDADESERVWAIMNDINPDIVTMDWLTKDIPGVDLIKQMRTASDSPNPFVPIIMLTGCARADQARQARDAGANEYLAKPVSVNGLMSCLVAVIEEPRPFVRTMSYFGPCRRRRGKCERQASERRVLLIETSIGAAAN